MNRSGYTHKDRHLRIAGIILRRQANGEPLDSRSIIDEAKCSSRTLKTVRDEMLLERSGWTSNLGSSATREHVLEAMLGQLEHERNALRAQVTEVQESLDAAQRTIAAQRESIGRFEGLLTPIWREMATQLDSLRSMTVAPRSAVPIPRTLADERDASSLMLENARLQRSMRDLVESNTALGRRNAELEGELSDLKCQRGAV